MKPLVAALFALALLSHPAQASSPPSGHEAAPDAEHGEAKEGKGEDGNRVVLPVLIAPVVQGQRLTGYLYLSIRLTADSDGNADHLRDVLPLVQDKLLRALHNAPVAAADADSPQAKDAVLKTVKDALQTLSDIRGIEDVALADYKNVPF